MLRWKRVTMTEDLNTGNGKVERISYSYTRYELRNEDPGSPLLAVVVKTGRTGVDNYPWEGFVEGPLPYRKVLAATLEEAKDTLQSAVAEALAATTGAEAGL